MCAPPNRSVVLRLERKLNLDSVQVDSEIPRVDSSVMVKGKAVPRDLTICREATSNPSGNPAQLNFLPCPVVHNPYNLSLITSPLDGK
jgi:hypothetical protein